MGSCYKSRKQGKNDASFSVACLLLGGNAEAFCDIEIYHAVLFLQHFSPGYLTERLHISRVGFPPTPSDLSKTLLTNFPPSLNCTTTVDFLMNLTIMLSIKHIFQNFLTPAK